MTAPDRTGPPVVAVYRSLLLAASETFIRSDALAFQRYAPLFVGDGRVAGGLALPEADVVVGIPGGRYRHAVLPHVPGYLLGRLERACRARGVALVHAHFGTDSLRALDLAERLGVPFVVSYHGFDAALSDAALRAGPRLRATCAGARSCSTRPPRSSRSPPSSRARSSARGLREAKLRVHHVGAPLGPPRPDPPREPVVLFVGRHVEKKGLGDLLEAMARVRASVPAARLLVVGDGPAARRDRGAGPAARRSTRGSPAGSSRDEVARQLREARVLCVPSRRAANGDAEGLPTVIPEAGGQGLPVVGTRHSGIPEGIGARGGLLADEGDVEGLAHGADRRS